MPRIDVSFKQISKDMGLYTRVMSEVIVTLIFAFTIVIIYALI